MSDVNANIGVQIDTSSALTELKNLQRQLAIFHASIAKTSAAAGAAQKGLQTNLLNSINATGQFTATMGNVRSSTESFTHALESNKLSMREYFRYAGGASKTFGRLFKQEFDTIGKVAEDRVKKMQTQYIKMGRDANGAIKAMAITPQTLNMNDYATKTALAAQKQALFNQIVRQGSTSLLNFGKNTQWAGRQLMVGFTIPLAYFGTTASKVFMDLEAQAIKFKRVYGDMFTTSSETNKALEDVRKLAEEFTKYGVAVSKTMEMAASAAAMGKTGADLTAQVAQATRLAVLGSVEQEQALETTISLTNAFGIAAENLASKINFLNSVENQTVVSIEDLTIAIPKAGPVVQQLGGDVEDLAFFLTAMKEGGINASEGANALKSGLASLINPSKKASAMLAGLGVNINGIVEANKGDIKNTVIGFAQALDTLAPLDRSRAIEQLFGKFQFARLSTLFQNITKEGTQASKVLQLAGASVEELAILSERELKTVEDAVGVNFKAAVEQLKLAIAPIGKTFLEAVTPIVKVIGDLLEKFNGLSDGTKKFIVVATTIVGGIGPILLMTFGLLANGVANIVKLFLALRTGFLRLGGNSKILAEQTNYLNAEQLESATVAASLNQAHTRLTQSFTAETTAVKLLRQAYIDATLAASNFARANPGMMMPTLRGGKTPKKFSDGETYVPGTGNKDSVASMLTPGEAVIPRGIAQDPQFQPIIDAMVSGDIKKYNLGVASAGDKPGTVNFEGKTFQTKTQKARENLINAINNDIDLAKLPGGVGITEASRVISNRLQSLQDQEKPLTKSRVFKHILAGRTTSTGAPRQISNLTQKSKPGFANEVEAIKEALKKQGISLTTGQEGRMFSVQASHLEDKRINGIKDWSANKVVADLGYVNNYVNTVKGKLGTELLAMSDTQLKDLGIDREELKKLQNGAHPINASAAKTFRAIAQYDLIANPGSSQAHAVVAGLDYRAKTGFYATPMKTLAETKPASSKAEKVIKSKTELAEKVKNTKAGSDSQQIMKQIDKDIRKTDLGKQAPTNFGTQISPTTGHSFPVKGLGGIYQKPDGTRVFVKPVMDAKAALAEQRATTIARDAHGLYSPKQEIKTMLDPTDPSGKRKLIVLESAFDSRFDPNQMTNRFTKDEYFKQLVAANLRGDKDLGRGNLSGNVLADVGTAGVFEKASGKRDFAKTMPSMAEQAKINLLGVKGGAKRFFAESTLDIPKGMTADQYHNNMIKEIDKVLPKLKSTVSNFNLDPAERTVYSAMITRLEEAKKVNWREFHKMHSSVLATKKEVLQDKKTGDITPIKGTSKPRNVVSSTGKAKDSVMTQVPVGKRIVQKPRGFVSSRFGKTILPGYADAPQATGTSIGDISQSQRYSKAQILAATAKISLNQAKKRIAAESKLTKAMEDSTKTTAETEKKTKLLGQKITTGINVFSGLSIAASFAGGKVGELAQKITPFVILLSTITMLGPSLKKGFLRLAPLLMNPVGLLSTALVAGVVAFKVIDNNNKKLAREQSRYIDQISATTEKMKSVGQVTDKVGASEAMALRGQSSPNEFSKGYDRAGQQFGTRFMGSEIGKEISTVFQNTLLKEGRSTAVKQFALELSSYVSDGVIDGVQAGDIARQLSVDLKDMSLYPSIVGQLTSIIGPDGANILTDPISVRLKIAKESQDDLKNVISAIDPVFSTRADFATVGAKSVQNIETTKAQAAATNFEYSKKLDIYKVDLAQAKTAKEKISIQNKIKSLTEKNIEDNKKLNDANLDNFKVMQDAFALTKGNSSQTAAFMEAAREQARLKFEGKPEAKLLDDLFKLSSKGGKSLELKITALAGSGTSPSLLKNLMTTFAGDEAKLSKQLDLGISLRGIDNTLGIIGSLGVLDDKEVVKDLFVKINSIEDSAEVTDIQSTLTKISEMDGKDFDVNVYFKTAGFAKLQMLTQRLRAIENVPDPIVKTTQIESIGLSFDQVEALSDNWTYFMSLPAEVRKKAFTTFVTAFEMAGADPGSIAAEIQKRLAGTSGAVRNELMKYLNSPAGMQDMQASIAKRTTEVQYDPKTGQPIKPPPGKIKGDGSDVLSKEAKLAIARLQKELDLLKTKRDTINETNNELKRQYDQQQRLMQLQQDATQAKISGNYIGAAIINQQKSLQTSEFNKETESLALDKKITALENKISAMTADVRLTNAAVALDKAKAKGKGMAMGGLIKGPGTGTSDSIPAMVMPGFEKGGPIKVSNGEYIFSKKAIDNLGGPKAVDSLHKSARSGKSKLNPYQNFMLQAAEGTGPIDKMFGIDSIFKILSGTGSKGDILDSVLGMLGGGSGKVVSSAMNNVKVAKAWTHYSQNPITEVLPSIGKQTTGMANYGAGTYGSTTDKFKGQMFGEVANKLSLSPLAWMKTALGKGAITDSLLAKESAEFAKKTGKAIPSTITDELATFLSKKGYSGYQVGDVITNWKIGSPGFGLKNNLGKLPFGKQKSPTAYPELPDMPGVAFAMGGMVGNKYSIPSYAVGVDYVPQDTVAMVHKGERILTAEENKRFNGGASSVSNTNNIYINGTDLNKQEIADEVMVRLEKAQKRNNKTNMVVM